MFVPMDVDRREWSDELLLLIFSFLLSPLKFYLPLINVIFGWLKILKFW